MNGDPERGLRFKGIVMFSLLAIFVLSMSAEAFVNNKFCYLCAVLLSSAYILSGVISGVSVWYLCKFLF